MIGIFGGSRRSCRTDDCRENGFMSGLLWIIGPALLTLTGLGVTLCCLGCQANAIPKHSSYINVPTSENNEEELLDNVNPFQSGLWSSRYFQHKQWHGPHQFSVLFDSQAMKVTGSGSDDVGSFTIDGIYSIKTRRIGLTKRYLRGTGNPSANFGHQVTIQLTWNAKNHQLEGIYYVITTKYDENKFELKFDRTLSDV